MTELRKDPVTGRFVIISTQRSERPSGFRNVQTAEKDKCPFCEGNESETPPEVFALREPHSKVDDAGWQVRVVPNKFPALKTDGDFKLVFPKRYNHAYENITSADISLLSDMLVSTLSNLVVGLDNPQYSNAMNGGQGYI